MIRVGVARTRPSYEGLAPPWAPGEAYPELAVVGLTSAAEPNLAYAAVRAALHGLGLDRQRFGTEAWNPVGELVRPGGRVVLKPNFIRHWNPLEGQHVESVITHGAVVRAMADYAWLAVGLNGSVAIAEAPQQDCDFARIHEIAGLTAVAADLEARGFGLEVIDLRRETVEFRDGVIVDRHPLPGDPQGYRVVDLGAKSFFADSGLDSARFRGADYDPGPTAEHHSGGRHEYLLSESVLSADLVINLPKLKTHKKTGVTLALKNLVGINGDKNWLPHHCLGSPSDGGDEFPVDRWIDRMRSRATEIARPLLARGRGLGLFRAARRLEGATRGDAFIRAGNWYGNRTTWRMSADLNRALYYSDAKGPHLAAPRPVRTVLTVIDGIIAGEGEGPLAPKAVPLGAVVAGTDPIAVDLACIRLMGFDERRIPKVWEPISNPGLSITEVRFASDVEVGLSEEGCEPTETDLDGLRADRAFEAHPGWIGHIERSGLGPGREQP